MALFERNVFSIKVSSTKRNARSSTKINVGGTTHSPGVEHWATFFIVKNLGCDAYAGRGVLGWMCGAHNQRARKLPELAPIAQKHMHLSWYK